jgi:hypothetical protein
MKTQKFTGLVLAAGLLLAGCSGDREELLGSDLSSDAKTSAQIDVITDDVANIIEDQYNQQSSTGRSAMDAQDAAPFLPDCATVTTVASGNSWQRTVDFGTTGCTMNNGNILKGKIIINGNTNFEQQSQTINYTFQNFYHNNRHVEGNRHVVRVLENSNGNPESNITLDMAVTFPNGVVITREGNRVREWTAGVNTPFIALDNEYSVTGSWVTTFPNATQNTVVSTPLVVKLACPNIVQGILTITRNSNTIILNYGSGACDNQATLSINGGNATTITLGN